MLALTLAVAACSGGPTDEGPPRYPLSRDWQYTAEQRAPSILRLSGEVRVTSQTGTRFDGSVDVVELDDFGTSERRTGVFGGRFRDSLTVDFDVHLDAEVRRHVGRISGDTISGEWAQSGSGSLSTGSFRMVRRP